MEFPQPGKRAASHQGCVADLRRLETLLAIRRRADWMAACTSGRMKGCHGRFSEVKKLRLKLKDAVRILAKHVRHIPKLIFHKSMFVCF